MPDPDYKALCAELLDAYAYLIDRYMTAPSNKDALVYRARTALNQPEKPTDEELLRMAASAIDPYESSGIAIGEYEPETQCAVEVYGSELIAYAHAVLARYGTPANNTRGTH
jgi:hypothetical protein